MSRNVATVALALAIAGLGAGEAPGQGPQQVIPHAQDRPPGPPLSPAEAIAKMTVPEGFRVELVASEPDIVNPVAMTFDERGRIWITESLEYPRREAGPGRDRVKVLEDTDGDGKADTFSIFADGLNIPSGIAVGHGGVWVANSPDILFYPNADGDLEPDGPPQVVVSGFGRDDTHELPNSLTWGPDGWLYGWNGVFNRSHIEHRGRTYDFTCAIFRINPRTRDFELFCEGTSNPWGIAFNPDGEAFASACVIDHLWHLTETGYYHRQGGEYPPFAWKLGSIVDHKHYKAAYCGIHYFDSDAYPAPFRDRLYMGNIHGNCINVDTLERRGATYRAHEAANFLEANDAWFMPVVQKTGPDGCLYILDWYDRYHCYQDANRDPEGIDRLKGRLYRVRFGDTPRAPRFDLGKESDEQLIERLGSPNVFYRDQAQRLLAERSSPAARPKLEALVLDEAAPRKARMHALWALIGAGPLESGFHERLLDHGDATLRAWGVRAAGNQRRVEPPVRDRVAALADDPDPAVALQVVIASRKVERLPAMPALVAALARHGDDPILPHIVWENLHPLLEDRAGAFVASLKGSPLLGEPVLAEVAPRIVERLLARRDGDPAPLVELVTALLGGQGPARQAAGRALAELAERVQTGEIAGDRLDGLRRRLGPALGDLLAERRDPLRHDAAALAASWRDPAAIAVAREALRSTEASEEDRLQALDALVAAGDAAPIEAADHALSEPEATTADFRGRLLAALGKLDRPAVARVVLARFDAMEPDLRPKAVELLTQRPAWSRALLDAVADGRVPADLLNINQIRQFLNSPDAALVARARAQWGTVREGRNPEREGVIRRMRDLLDDTPGDPYAGQQVFARVCGQCHTIYGQGQDVGPDLTGVGRSDFEQMLSNVFDPSLVIGTSYQATTVATADGRVLTGLLVEDNPQRIVLKTQGGKTETVPRADVDALKVSEVSLMPEDVEKQLQPQEIADLFAFLCLDKPPGDPAARRLPGGPEIKLRPKEDR